MLGPEVGEGTSSSVAVGAVVGDLVREEVGRGLGEKLCGAEGA